MRANPMRANVAIGIAIVLTLINVGMFGWLVTELKTGTYDFSSPSEITAANNTVRFGDVRHSRIAGGQPNQGSLTLFDRATDKQFVEFGFYNFGAGIFTPHRFEFWTGEEVSVAGINRLPVFQVRNKEDTKSAVWINGDSMIGSQWGQLGFAFGSFNGGWKEVGTFKEDGSLTVLGDISMQGQSLAERLAKIEAKLAGQ